MDIPIDARVSCYDGDVGKSSYIIVDLVTEQVTHFVVKTDHPSRQFVVPIEKIRDTDRTVILLDCHKEDVYQLPLFDESHFHGYDDYNDAPPVPSPGMAESYTLYQPYRTAESTTEEDAAAYSSGVEVAVKKGADVLATDARVGKVDELVIDPETHRITHLVLRQHNLVSKWIVTIPVSEIERVEKDTIFLKIDKDAVEALPAVALKKFPWE
jgi:sporulation protein YlmC with PRC-barrel domain